MARQLYSTEFLGVRLVIWGYRPRRAVKVYKGSYTVALLPNGSVAVDAERCFERPVYRPARAYTNERLAADLYALGVISEDAFNKHKLQCDAEYQARQRRDAASSLENLGIKLTKRQLAQIARDGAA